MLAAVKHDVIAAFVLLALFGLGIGVPLLAIAYGGRYLSQRLLRLYPDVWFYHEESGAIVVRSAIAPQKIRSPPYIPVIYTIL